MTKLHLIISGRVQGVGLRWFIERIANEYSLNGWVRNLAAGTVEVEAFGDKDNLEKLLQECRRGPRLAKIEKIDVEWGESEDSRSSFMIK